MASNEERLKILTMLQDGIISAAEAAQLLEALNDPKERKGSAPTPPLPPAPPDVIAGRPGRFLRVRVTDTDSGKVRVNVRLPVNLISSGLKFGMRFAPEVEGLDPDELIDAIRSGEMGQIVDVYDDDDGEHVEVFIE
jgi:hypothetical protein